MTIRAKYKLDEIRPSQHSKQGKRLIFSAVAADLTLAGDKPTAEVIDFGPEGRLEIPCEQPKVAALFEVGKVYHLDFNPAG